MGIRRIILKIIPVVKQKKKEFGLNKRIEFHPTNRESSRLIIQALRETPISRKLHLNNKMQKSFSNMTETSKRRTINKRY